MAASPNPSDVPATIRGCPRCRAALVAIAEAPTASAWTAERSLRQLDDAVRVASLARAAHGPASGLVPDDGSPLEPGDWCRGVRLISELGGVRSGGEDGLAASGRARAIANRALGRAHPG